MSSEPKVHLVAFKDRTTPFIFVGVPNEKGRYIRTDRSVALVACPMCKSLIGEPCTGAGNRYGGVTHVHRRLAARTLGRVDVDDVIAIELAPDGTAVEL